MAPPSLFSLIITIHPQVTPSTNSKSNKKILIILRPLLKRSVCIIICLRVMYYSNFSTRFLTLTLDISNPPNSKPTFLGWLKLPPPHTRYGRNDSFFEPISPTKFHPCS